VKPYEAYMRVSRTGGRTEDDPTLLGPGQQREAIRRHAEAKGLGELRWNDPELDATGSKLSRPVFDEILARIRAGQSKGVVVASLDRFSRAGAGEAIMLVEEVLAAGGTVVAADLGVDPKTPEGKLIVTVWLGMARMQWEQIQAKWAKAVGSAVARGAWVGPAPRGYDKVKGGTLVANDDLPLIANVFFASANDGLPEAKRLCEEYWPDANAWSTSNVRKLLEKRVYRGDAYSGKFFSEGAVPAAVNADVWALAQPPATNGRKPNGDYPLSKIAECGSCGTKLTGYSTSRDRQARGMRCRNPECSAKAHCYAGALEEIVLDELREAGDRWGREQSVEEQLALNAKLIAARSQFDEFLAAPRPDDMDEEEWQARRRGLKALVEEARHALDAAGTAAQSLPDLDDDSPATRRRAFELTVAKLVVSHGRGGDLRDRVALELTA
jgi:DNA invertase Pin-like site-specific DNA recombinase